MVKAWLLDERANTAALLYIASGGNKLSRALSVINR
jgi:hypothetical protein